LIVFREEYGTGQPVRKPHRQTRRIRKGVRVAGVVRDGHSRWKKGPINLHRTRIERTEKKRHDLADDAIAAPLPPQNEVLLFDIRQQLIENTSQVWKNWPQARNAVAMILGIVSGGNGDLV